MSVRNPHFDHYEYILYHHILAFLHFSLTQHTYALNIGSVSAAVLSCHGYAQVFEFLVQLWLDLVTKTAFGK